MNGTAAIISSSGHLATKFLQAVLRLQKNKDE